MIFVLKSVMEVPKRKNLKFIVYVLVVIWFFQKDRVIQKNIALKSA